MIINLIGFLFIVLTVKTRVIVTKLEFMGKFKIAFKFYFNASFILYRGSSLKLVPTKSESSSECLRRNTLQY